MIERFLNWLASLFNGPTCDRCGHEDCPRYTLGVVGSGSNAYELIVYRCPACGWEE